MSLVCSYLFEVGMITYFKVNYVLRQDRSGVFEELDVLTRFPSQHPVKKVQVEAFKNFQVKTIKSLYSPVRDGVANVLLLMVDIVRGECEAREGG